MGVIFFLVLVRKHESNLPTNIPTTGEENFYNYMQKNATFWVKPHCCLILWQRGVFSFKFTNVCIFLPMVFIIVFITTVCFYDFCKTLLLKKYTPCRGIRMIWFFQSKLISFTLAFNTANINTHFDLFLKN